MKGRYSIIIKPEVVGSKVELPGYYIALEGPSRTYTTHVPDPEELIKSLRNMIDILNAADSSPPIDKAASWEK